MTHPAPLQQLADRYNELVSSYTAGHITQGDALGVLASSSVQDALGAVWSISPEGHFLRADYPGAPAAPADPSTFAAAGTPVAPQPAFPSPAGFASDLDTPPVTGPNRGWGAATGPSAGPVQPLPTTQAEPAKSLKATKEPKERSAVAGRALDLVLKNKVFALILIVGAIVIAAAVIVPKMSGDSGTQMPTDTVSQLPGAGGDATAPAATAAVPTTADAAAVAAALQSGDATKIQTVVAAALDDVTLLRAQALWSGIAQTGTVVTPQPAASTGDGKAAQVWQLTRDGQSAPTAEITVNWTTDGTTWKVDAVPTF